MLERKLTQDIICLEFGELSEFRIIFWFRCMVEELQRNEGNKPCLSIHKNAYFSHNFFLTKIECRIRKRFKFYRDKVGGNFLVRAILAAQNDRKPVVFKPSHEIINAFFIVIV